MNKSSVMSVMKVSTIVVVKMIILTHLTVIIDTPNGPAPPLVTGSFGSADFMHSMMGEMRIT